MVGWPKILISIAVGVGCVVGLTWTVIVQGPSQIATSSGAATDDRRLNAEDLESEVRAALPAGSSLVDVETFLTKLGLEFSFEARTKTVFAVARKLPGSRLFASKSLAFKFHFDDGLALNSIEAEVIYTGP